MNLSPKQISIIISVVAILIVAGVWIYLASIPTGAERCEQLLGFYKQYRLGCRQCRPADKKHGCVYVKTAFASTVEHYCGNGGPKPICDKKQSSCAMDLTKAYDDFASYLRKCHGGELPKSRR